MPKILFIFGTRPEAIKMVPIYKKLDESSLFSTAICITAQHREMLDSVMHFFDVEADYDLDIMQENQTLETLSARMLLKISAVLDDFKPDLVLVHGDTTTSFIASLSAFYKQTDVAHIEAGLRTHNIYSPFPEEMNRQLTSKIAKYHFTPTEQTKANLLHENIDPKNIYVVGNSVVDALFLTLDKIKKEDLENTLQSSIPYKFNDKKIILITGHRRENFGDGFLNICNAIKELALKYPAVDFVYPVHLNPNVQEPVKNILSNISNIFLIKPLNYELFVYIMSKAYIILTDSGGIQEEAPSLGKPVLVMRENTERPEAVDHGTVKLVGTSEYKIIHEVSEILNNPMQYTNMSKAHNPYGDGETSNRILNILKESL